MRFKCSVKSIVVRKNGKSFYRCTTPGAITPIDVSVDYCPYELSEGDEVIVELRAVTFDDKTFITANVICPVSVLS